MAAARPRPRQTPPPEPAQPQPRLQDLVVITGFSGAGKSTAMQVFEDAGYFCVDNLPPEMIRGLVELLAHPGSKVERAAVVSDVRGGELFEALVDVLAALEDSGIAHRVLFLDADEETLMTRYKETRRRHPLAPAGTVPSGIAAERSLLVALKSSAEFVVDTTGLSARGLRRLIADELLPRDVTGRMAVTFSSFGFKHGPPRDADLVFDVRFLPNPHYVHHLRLLTGHDQRVVDYVGREGKLDDFYERLMPLLEFVVPEYVSEGKAHLTVAIGCTGGRHRSVAIAEELAKRFGGRDDLHVDVAHRDIDKAPKGP
jgi:UPF0042 nucleotide-binding protein